MLVKLEYHKKKFQFHLSMMHWKNLNYMNWKKVRSQVVLTLQDVDLK